MTSIEPKSFFGCHALTNIVIPNSVTNIGAGAFWGCTSLTNITLPNSVTNIGESAFYDCSNLTNITLPNSVTNIGKSAFAGCSNLKTISIPNSVKTIRQSTFWRCEKLSAVILPSSLTYILEGVFASCSNLKSITCYALYPPVIYTQGGSYGSYPKNVTLYVPESSVLLYENTINTVWKKMCSEILPIPEENTESDFANLVLWRKNAEKVVFALFKNHCCPVKKCRQ